MSNIINKIKAMLQNEKYRQVIIFSFIGAINTLVDISVSFVLKGVFGILPYICQIAGYSAGTLNSFILNKTFTFRDKTKSQKSLPQLFKFIIVNLISLGVSLAVLHILIDKLSLNFYVSKVFVTVFSLAINFIGSKFWVFVNSDKGL